VSERSLDSLGIPFANSFSSDNANVRKPCAVISSFEEPMRRQAVLTMWSLIARASDFQSLRESLVPSLGRP
jgi:hypothetical protein